MVVLTYFIFIRDDSFQGLILLELSNIIHINIAYQVSSLSMLISFRIGVQIGVSVG